MVNGFYSHASLTNEINNNISIFLLVIDEEMPVGFISYTLIKDVDITCEINAMYCLPETQGKRFDELLVKEAIKSTIAEGGNKIFVVLTDYNGPVSMFERLGFEPLQKNVPKKLNSEIIIMSKHIRSFPK
jgi:N-acetylglutamate synthase-like GNAT family acetyltransferase